MYKHFTFEIETKTDDRKNDILDYLQTHLYEKATEVKDEDLLMWILENTGRSFADYINFFTTEDEDGNVTEVYYITEDGQLEYIPYDEPEEDIYTFSVRLPKKDYDILNKWGFYFQKNIADYLHDVAMEVFQAEKNNKNC